MEIERTDAGRDGRTYRARPNSQARTSTKLSVEHTLSLCTALLMYAAHHFVKGHARKRRSRRGWRHTSEVLIGLEEGTQYICKFFEGVLRHPVLTPKTVGAALVEVFAVLLPVEATTPLIDATPNIGSEHDISNV